MEPEPPIYSRSSGYEPSWGLNFNHRSCAVRSGRCRAVRSIKTGAIQCAARHPNLNEMRALDRSRHDDGGCGSFANAFPRRLQQLGVAVSAVQGVLLIGIGGWLIWYSTSPVDGLGAIELDLIAAPWLVSGFGLLLAAFLIARRGLPWQIVGAITYVGLTVGVGWALISVGQYYHWTF